VRALLRFKDGPERETELADSTTRTIRLAEVVRDQRGEARVVYRVLRWVGEAPDGAAMSRSRRPAHWLSAST
jgi:hypothetical protein